MRDSGEGQMGYWRRKACEWFRVISRAYESFPRVPPNPSCCHWWGWKKYTAKQCNDHTDNCSEPFMAFPETSTLENAVWWTKLQDAASYPQDLRLKKYSSSASAFQELGQQIICKLNTFSTFFFNLVTQQRDAHLGRNDLSGPTAARLGSSLEEKQYFLLLWQPQAKHFLIGWKRHSSSAHVEKQEDLKFKKKK